MKGRIPWVRLVAEGLVIVVSILLAFAVDAWWSEAQDRRAARQGLEAVLEELEVARSELETIAWWHERNLDGIRTLRAAADAVPSGGTITVPDTLLTALILVQVGDVPTHAVDAFLTSGRANQGGTPELRRELLAWTALLDDVRDDEVRLRTAIDASIQKLTDAFDVSSVFDVALAMFMAGSGVETEVRVTPVEVPVDLVFTNGLASQASAYGVMAFQARNAHQRAGDLADRIAAELR